MGLSLIELAMGRYPIPPLEQQEINNIFSKDTLELHLQTARTGAQLPGNMSLLFSDKKFDLWNSLLLVYLSTVSTFLIYVAAGSL